MKKKCMKKMLFLAVLLPVMTVFLSCNGAIGRNKLKIGVGEEGGTYYSYMNHFAELSGEAGKIEISTTAGSAACIRLLQKGFLDGAVVQNDVLYDAMQGNGIFAGEAMGEMKFGAVAGLYTEALQIVVSEESGIGSVKDLSGKRISVGEEESGVCHNAQLVLNSYGISLSEAEVRYLSFTDSAEALRNGEIDAFFCIAGTPATAVTNLAADREIRLIPFGPDDIKRLMVSSPYFTECTIPAGTYPGVEEDIQTVGVRAVFVMADSVSDKRVSEITKELLDCGGELNSRITTDESLTAQSAAGEVSIAFHPGAAQVLKENGVMAEIKKKTGNKTVFGGQDQGG